MINKIIHLLLLTLILNSCSSQKKGEQQLVQNSFNNYKSSILNDKGTEAIKYLDSRTISYYKDILDKTKNADSITVNSLGFMDKLMVFSIRHRATREDILSFDGKSLLVYAIKEGMVGKNSVSKNTVGEVNIVGDFAKGQVVSDGQKTDLYFHFYKEDGIWKIDLTSLFPIGTSAFKKMQEDSGLGENEYLFMVLESITGKKVKNTIWNTIK